MDELKQRAGERFDALHEAAKTAADTSKSKVQDAVNSTSEAFRKIREAFNEVWHHELIAESRRRVVVWTQDAVRRIKEGAPPLSPVVLYEELVALFKDRVWRRSVLIFVCGVAVGGGAGAAVALRVRGGGGAGGAGGAGAGGPHCRALHTLPDHSVMLVGDAVAKSAGPGEVLVRVQAVSVCAVDRCVLRGRGAVLRGFVHTTHVTVGRGFAGVVLDVGVGVDDLELGDAVWGALSEWSGGAASELLTVRSTRVSKRPPNIGVEAAAALVWGGTGALRALHMLRYTPDDAKGKRVVVCGANSETGVLLVQVLSGWGAHTTAAATAHHAHALQDLGAAEFVELSSGGLSPLEQAAARGGPWDGVVLCGNAPNPAVLPHHATTLLKARAPRGGVLDVRARALASDALPAPAALLLAAALYTYRLLRWMVGYGTHTDWLEDVHRLRYGLNQLHQLVDSGHIHAVLDKSYQPQDFEAALAHACSDDAFGTTVIRFP